MDGLSHLIVAGIAERYEIERELGRGGMATVYLARDVRHQRHVAVKVMRPDVSASLGTERFLREVRVAAGLNHPHVLTLHDSGRVPAPSVAGAGPDAPGAELLYYVMPFVDGESLRDRLRREGALPIVDTLRIASEVADALAFAHAHGVIHRDIKPENVLLAGSGPGATGGWHAVVADFGIARLLADSGADLTATGISVGTPGYMSPEQAAGERVDARADIYSLGCLVYEMLVGEPPFTGPTASAIITRHLTAPVPSIRALRPSVPADLEALVHRALEKVPADRIGTALELKTAVDGIRARATTDGTLTPLIAAQQAGSASSDGRWTAHRWGALGAGAAMVAALGIGAAWLVADRRGAATSVAASAEPALDRRRVTVLPLRTVGDADDAYIADALTDDLISALGRVGGLRVLARSAVSSPDSANRSPADIARALGAGSFIQGTLHQRGDSVRFTVALADARTGDQSWGTTYRRRSHELAGLQDSVAAEVARRLGATDSPGMRSRSSTTNGDAYDVYLRGMFLTGEGTVVPPTVADSAIRLFERALVLDSGFAVAHASIARVANTVYFTTDPNPAWAERAFLEIEKALALDPNLAEAYQEKGSATWTRSRGFPHEAAARLHRKAVALKPSAVEPHNSLGSIYMHIGLLDRALAEYDTALALDPTTTFVPGRIARVHWYMGKYTEALREYEAIATWPNNFVAERALVLNYLGRRAEALALLDSTVSIRRYALNYDIQAARAVVLAAGGNRDAAREAIRMTLAGDTAASHFHHAAYSLAEAYALLGDRDRALEFLRRTAADGMPCYPLFRDDPHLRSLASDPRFVQFMGDLRDRHERLAKTIE